MPTVLQPDLQQILSQLISFVLLVIILKRVAWRPLLSLLDARRAHIEQELRQAAEANAGAARLQQEYARHLAAIDEQGRATIQQAVLEGKRIALEIQEQARAQAEQLLKKSEQTIDLELAKAKAVLRDEVAAMTLDALERVLRQKVDAATDQRLIESTLDELEGAATPR